MKNISKVCPPKNGIRVLWSWVNQAYLILWCDLILAIKSNKEDAIAEYQRIVGND